MTTVALKWEKGGDASIVKLAGEVIVVVSSTAAPPGARLQGTLGDGKVVRLKSHGSKKQDDGTFRIEGRTIDMARDLRLSLEQALTSATSGQ